MSEDVKAQKSDEPKKVVRRGLGSARGTSKLKFSHEQAKTNGLFLAHLEDVVVSEVNISDSSTGMPSFNGFTIPKISFTFASNEEDANKRHYVYLTFMAVESNAETIPGGKNQWQVDQVFDWLKHILNVYLLKGRELNDEEVAALSLSYEDFNEQGEYVPVDTEVVISSWKTLFENFENIVNRGKDGAPIYKTKDGKYIPIWLKLIRYNKTTKGWKAVDNGNLALPRFVGEGCIDIYKQNTPAAIRIDTIRECIIPMKIDEPKTPNMPSGPNIMGGVPVGDNMIAGGFDANAIVSETESDMPF